MADIDRDDYRDVDQDLLIEDIKERRRNRRGCLCGYPDWPGRCPGPAACPVHGQEFGEEEEYENG